jgi:valyl-tRNA synthetase
VRYCAIGSANRLVNWCCHLRSAISDIEVDHIALSGPTNIQLPSKGTEKRKVRFGVGYEFLYPLADDAKAAIVSHSSSSNSSADNQLSNGLMIFTTRPETILGDVAVAVHPDDVRYQHLIGTHVVHPFDGRQLPIIADGELVQMDKGSGVVKITPAHDPNDYACALRHSLPSIDIFDDEGCISRSINSVFSGIDRFEARSRILGALKKQSLLIREVNNPMTVAICSRSGDVLEPLLKPQWYVRCTPSASSSDDTAASTRANGGNVGDRARSAVASGETLVFPSFYKDEYLRWLSASEARDWCISRQLWWGHRVPAYRIKNSAAAAATTTATVPTSTTAAHASDACEWVIARSADEAKRMFSAQTGMHHDAIEVEQDPDVLDTWFSSALLPLSALGWPTQPAAGEATTLLDRYPLSVMETGSDILFFWVARMMMLCTELDTASNHRAPFKHVSLHPMVRDKDGKKMSKSKGNVIDPLHVINGCTLEQLQQVVLEGNISKANQTEARKAMASQFPHGIAECGADALRFTLCSYMTHNFTTSVNMELARIVRYRNFCNKIWNAMHFLFANTTPELRYSITANGDSCQVLASNYYAPTSTTPRLLERWILSKLAKAVRQVAGGLEQYTMADSTNGIYTFYVTQLCDVFIEFAKMQWRHDRASDMGSDDALGAILVHCNDVLLRLLHPFMPHLSEVCRTTSIATHAHTY